MALNHARTVRQIVEDDSNPQGDILEQEDSILQSFNTLVSGGSGSY
jgi:hypothetical protein